MSEISKGDIVYLAGPIDQCNDTEMNGWRQTATDVLSACGAQVIDPTQRDFRESDIEEVYQEIVEGDLAEIARADVLLANAWKKSVGTSMEIWEAHRREDTTTVVVTPNRFSPWHLYAADRHFHQLARALDFLA